jgi:hypothetical protein
MKAKYNIKPVRKVCYLLSSFSKEGFWQVLRLNRPYLESEKIQRGRGLDTPQCEANAAAIFV